MERENKDIEKVIKKLEGEIVNADKALIEIQIAKESQEYLLKFWKEQIK